MCGELQLDLQAFVTKDLFCFADNGIGKLGMEFMSRFELAICSWLNDRDADRFVRVDRNLYTLADIMALSD